MGLRVCGMLTIKSGSLATYASGWMFLMSNLMLPPGVLTLRQQVAAQIGEAVSAVMRGVASDPKALAEVVARGPYDWRVWVQHEFAGILNDGTSRDALANLMFRFFEQQHLQRFGGLSPAQVMDGLEVKEPPTKKELMESWTIESASSDEGRRAMYGDSNPQEFLRRLCEDKDEWSEEKS